MCANPKVFATAAGSAWAMPDEEENVDVPYPAKALWAAGDRGARRDRVFVGWRHAEPDRRRDHCGVRSPGIGPGFR
jgi:hypothetical protein